MDGKVFSDSNYGFIIAPEHDTLAADVLIAGKMWTGGDRACARFRALAITIIIRQGNNPTVIFGGWRSGTISPNFSTGAIQGTYLAPLSLFHHSFTSQSDKYKFSAIFFSPRNSFHELGAYDIVLQ